MTLQYVVCDYMATGEGSTICILVTMAYPKHEDYEESNSHINPDGSFHFEMPKLRDGITRESIALREFTEEFSYFYAKGAQVLTEEQFRLKWLKHCPAYMLNMLDAQHDPNKAAGNIYYASKLHVNYS